MPLVERVRISSPFSLKYAVLNSEPSISATVDVSKFDKLILLVTCP